MTEKKANDRSDALNALRQVFEKQQPLSSKQLAKLSKLSKEICFGVCRYYFFLEKLTHKWVKKPNTDLQVKLCLLIGLYQLHFLRVPEYAAVKETVQLLQIIKKSWAKGFINAVLRSYCREKESLPPLTPDINHPVWMVNHIKKAWPNQYLQILAANDVHPPMTLRVRDNKNTYLTRLEQAGINAEDLPDAPQGIIINTPCAVTDLPGFDMGDVSVQDGAAQLSVEFLDLKPRQRILDACCAPGGKTSHILEREKFLKECVAIDNDEKRITRVKENLARLNLKATVIVGDSSQPQQWWNGDPFDRILLDAPCSATGVIRRHPDIKLLRTPEDIQNILAIQKTMLQALWPLLAPKGRMVYATCSILPEENELMIAEFIQNTPNAQTIKPEIKIGHWTGHGLQILPGEKQMDGFFYAILEKKNQT